MKRFFILSALLTALFCLLPGLFLLLYFLKAEKDLSISWSKWQERASHYYQNPSEKKDKSETPQGSKTHFRKDIVRQIWFRPLEKGSSLYLKASESEIRLEPQNRGFKAVEHFKNMEAGFQDQPAWGAVADTYLDSPKEFPDLIESSPSYVKNTFSSQDEDKDETKWVLRVIQSQEAYFDYSRQLLTADKVDIRLYRLMRPLDFTRYPLPSENLAYLQGFAKKIYLDCKAKPAQFKAVRFKASLRSSDLPHENETL